MTESPRVNFLIAGVQKAGTTALFDYLAESGDVALSRAKETHFFDDDSLDWRTPDYRPYHALFGDARGRPCGEATPIYLYWPGSLERIATYNPAMRIIVLLRDPVERAWSHWRMEYARGVETRPFDWCVRRGRMRLFEAEPWGHHRYFSYVERGFYGEQIERLYGLFAREQVLILKATDLRTQPTAVLTAVRNFLGLGPTGGPVVPKVSHPARSMDYGSELTPEDAGFLGTLYAHDQARLRALTGADFQ